MAYSRVARPEPRPPTDVLTARMVGIGMSFAAPGETDADLEGTLLHASSLGMEEHDLRVLGVLTTWFGAHHTHVNADRLVRLVAAHDSRRVRTYWAALAAWHAKDRRFARLANHVAGAPVELLAVGTDFQIRRRGEDARFAGSKLRVPSGALRDRLDDVLSPERLVRHHAGYRNRVLMGPTWRADVWTVLEKAPDLSVAEVARRAACSFATAWQAAQDFKLLRLALP
ncbi:MAG: hypothetical protein H7138_12320 [Myxococcales bacterium]|nr:hypothetical protein [Myxococcales bacterium]